MEGAEPELFDIVSYTALRRPGAPVGGGQANCRASPSRQHRKLSRPASAGSAEPCARLPPERERCLASASIQRNTLAVPAHRDVDPPLDAVLLADKGPS